MEAWSTVSVAIVLLGAGFAAIGDDVAVDDVAVDAEDVEQVATHHVHIEDFAMDPDPLTIEVGDTVEWHNHDSVSHTATADDNGWDTGTIPPGATESITFTETTTDTYFCAVHPQDMTDFVLEVIEPNDEPSVAIQAPEDGALLEGEVTIEGTAADPDGDVELVEVRIDGEDWQTAWGAESWSLSWDTRQVVNGDHTIEARSFDGIEHSPVASVDVLTDNPSPDLSVQAIQASSSLGEATIMVTVANEGQATAVASELSIRYEADNAQGSVATEPLPALGVGETVQTQTSWDTLGKVGAFELIAHADPDGELPDPEPANDVRETTICVPDAEGVSCMVPGTEAPV